LTRRQSEIVRAGYDRLSEAYRPDATPDDYGEYAAWVRLLAELLPGRAPVLDIGCGCGLPATKLLAERFEVTGVDFSEVQIARAKRLVPSAEFLCEDITASSFPEGAFAAVVSFYAIIHMPLEEHPRLFRKVASWLRPAGYFLGIVGHDAWTGSDPMYLGIEGGEMSWSHADEATNLGWLQDSGLLVQWKRFVPEGNSGHTLVLAQKPPVC
jgi:SAM-dependent methyltransferase